jgi:hypothetical protein
MFHQLNRMRKGLVVIRCLEVGSGGMFPCAVTGTLIEAITRINPITVRQRALLIFLRLPFSFRQYYTSVLIQFLIGKLELCQE